MGRGKGEGEIGDQFGNGVLKLMTIRFKYKVNGCPPHPGLSAVVINAAAMADVLPLPRGPFLILNGQSVWGEGAHFFHGRPSCSVDNVC